MADAAAPRERWSGQFTFILASIGSAIGFGNVWRFPMLAYTHGGGAFLVPYFFALFFATIPVVTLEFALGQRLQKGHVALLRALSPRAVGLGWASVIGTFTIATFYSSLLAYCVVYLVGSVQTPQPWAANASQDDVAAAHEHFLRGVLERTGGFDATGGLVPHLAAAYFGVWLCVCAGANGARAIGWMVKVLMPLPFVVLGAFLVRALTLSGAGDGIALLLTPDFSKVASFEIWITATSQLFFGVSAGLGTLTTYASYNDAKRAVLVPASIVCCANSAFSLLAGVVVFAFLGHAAELRGVAPTELVQSGPALAFEIFPAAVALMPAPQLWAFLFFAMLLNLGISSAISMTSPLCVALAEALANGGPRARALVATGRRRLALVGVVHALGFAAGLLFCTRAGVLYVELADHYVVLLLTVVTALGECVLASCCHGARTLLKELHTESASAVDRLAAPLLAFAWRFFIPAVLTVLLVATVVGEVVAPWGIHGVDVPPWALALGWTLGLGPAAVAVCAAFVLRPRAGGAGGSARPGLAAADGARAVAEIEFATPNGGTSTASTASKV